nr:metalloregulator ArsR/SmtB family transcription factor [uncultured Peptostreptococcus sp.]
MDDNIELCQDYCIHKDRIDLVKSDRPTDEMIYDLAELFKIFGDVTRIKIIYALLEYEMCVCDIASLLDMTQSAISHQLRVLKKARLVKFRKEGKIVFYSLDDDHIDKIFSFGLDHIKETYY